MDNFKEQITLDFGVVFINSKLSKIFPVTNNASINQVYKVEKHCDKLKLNNGFNITPSTSPSVKPGETFAFKVEFIPTVAGTTCCDNFIIKHLFGVEAFIFTQALVKGPECSVSCKKVQIVCPAAEKRFSKKFEISNNGECSLDFKFCCDSSYSRLTLEPLYGSISATKQLQVTITYTPTDWKPYFKRIFCLINNHAPIVLDVYAIRSKTAESITWKICKENLPEYSSSYCCFLYNSMNPVEKKEEPVVSVQENNIDFGHCFPKDSRQTKFSLTNKYSSKVSGVWRQGTAAKAFKIQPADFELDSNSTTEFTASFKPYAKNMLFGAVMEAQLFADENLLPFPLEINLKGDSFEDMSCGWSAQYSVEPTSVVLPPSMSQPFSPVHTTLTIRQRGHLPLSFKFNPPSITNFNVKPLQGLIEGNHQIVVVQFHPKSFNDALYTEKWILCFNSNDRVNQCTVELCASIETPQLIVNNGQDVVFPNLHPGTTWMMHTDFYNPTRLTFSYSVEVLKGDPVLEVETSGVILPHEHKQVALFCSPQGLGSLDGLIHCTPLVEENVGFRSTMVTVRCTCVKTKLEVLPHGLLFDRVLRDCVHDRGFQIINNGDALIEATLMWHPGEGCKPLDLEVQFQPETFILESGNSVMVEVTVIPRQTGSKVFFIGYSTNDYSAEPLLPVLVNTIFPQLQVTDIRINSTGSLFTKSDFWKMLQINELNKVLKSVRPTAGEYHCMNMPSYPSKVPSKVVEILLENQSDMAVNLFISAHETCDCKPVRKQISFSRSRWDRNCMHKDQIQISPYTNKIEANSHVILSLKVLYTTVGSMESLFIFTITPEDHEESTCSLRLYVERTSVPDFTPNIDSCVHKHEDSFVLNMAPVFIGDMFPRAQALVLYNNSAINVVYNIDDKELANTPFTYIGKRNSIAGMTNHELLFTFLPSSCKTYEAYVTLSINKNEKKIILIGTGVASSAEEDEDQEVVPRKEKLNDLRPPDVYLSSSHINVGPLKPRSTQRHVLFLHNNTDNIVAFKWYSTKIPEVVDLRVHPTKGAVKPHTASELRVAVSSRGWPCRMTCSLSCVYSNYSQYAKTVQAITKYEEDLERYAGHFVINEQGKQKLVLKPPEDNWPKKDYLTVSVSVDVRTVAKDQEELLPFTPATIQPNIEPCSDWSDEQRIHIIHMLEIILWDVLNDVWGNIQRKEKVQTEQYIQTRVTAYQREKPVSRQVMQTVLEDLLYSTWRDMFKLHGRGSSENLRKTLLTNLHSPTGRYSVDSAEGLQRIPTLNSISESFISQCFEKLKQTSK